MDLPKIRQVLLNYINLVSLESENSVAPILRLELALDEIAYVYRLSQQLPKKTDHPGVPRKNYNELRSSVQKIFPTLGYYNTPNEITENIGNSEMCVGDAIDDITDLALDLNEIIWRWDNIGCEDALWHFDFGYTSHWGMHIRCLQLYLLAHDNGL